MAHNNTTRRMVALCCVWLATLASFALQLFVVNNSMKHIPQSICYTARGGMDIAFEDVADLASGYVASVHAAVSGFALSDTERTPVNVDINLTDEPYGELTAMQMLYGSYFKVSAVPEENMVAVIPAALSLHLYKTYDAVGSQIILNDKAYTVCGVYKPVTSPLYALADTANMRVYIPFSAYGGYNDLPNKQLWLSDGANRFSDNIMNDVRNSMKKWLNYDTADNYSDTTKLLAESIEAALFLCGSTLVVLLGWMLLRAVYSAVNAVGAVRRRVISIAVAAAAGAAIVGILALCRFEPFIPAQYLPNDNIFDIAFYVDRIVANIQAHNAIAQLNPMFYYTASLLVATALHAAVTWTLCIVATVRTHWWLDGVR